MVEKAKEIQAIKRCPSCNAPACYLDYKIERNADGKQRGLMKCKKCGWSDGYKWIKTEDLYATEGAQ